MKIFYAFAILSSIAAAPAMAESFTHEGTSYEYTVKNVGKYRIISGTNLTTGSDFSLRVKGTSVTGRFGDAPVRFEIAPEAANSGGSSVFAAK